MKKLYFIICACLLLASLNAQTRRIAHKSHSGTASTYKLLVKKKAFDYTGSNFGRAPEPTVRNARLDSVIAFGPRACIMVTRECWTRKSQSTTPKWRAGRDTVYNHPLFSHIHSLDSIRRVVDLEYHFQNPASEVVFIGYDNTKLQKRSKK